MYEGISDESVNCTRVLVRGSANCTRVLVMRSANCTSEGISDGKCQLYEGISANCTRVLVLIVRGY